MYDIILFTSNHGFPAPQRVAGVYRIGSILRSYGYSVKIIDFFIDLYIKHESEFELLLAEYIGPNTKFIGISGTFLQLTNYLRHTNLFDPFNEEKRNKRFEYQKHSEYMFEKLLYKIKKRYNIPIVLGGYTTATKHIWKKYNNLIDHWVDGFADTAIIQFLKTNNSPKYFKYDHLATGYNFRESLPMFHIDDLVSPYEALPFELSRGCRFKCKFCNYPLLGKKPNDVNHYRSTESIYNELLYNYENFGTKRYILLCDTFNEAQFKIDSFEEAIDKLGISLQLMAYNRLDLIWNNEKQLDQLYRIGFRGMHFGIESLNDMAAKSIGKGLGSQRSKEALDMIKQKYPDILTLGSFICGLPHETLNTFNKWNKDIVDGVYKIDSVAIGGLVIPRITENVDMSFISEFSRFPEKYGYSIIENSMEFEDNDTLGLSPTTNVIWKNDNWDVSSSQYWSWYWNDQFFKKGAAKLSPWLATSISGFGDLDNYFEWNKIVNRKKNDFDESRVNKWTSEILNTYWENITQ